jgi:preprotein translocase subunit SecY
MSAAGPTASSKKEDVVLGAFANAFRTPDLRRKLLFVLFIITIFRLGSQIPAPGVNFGNVRSCLDQQADNSLYTLINLFSGGALLQLTIFALGIMPYITASIILQLLVVVIPRLEALKKEGQSGQTKITQYTRYLTLGLALLQATGIVALARSGQLIQNCDLPLLHSDGTQTFLVMVVTMTAGTAVIMWLGELITEHGVGNGMSLMIFTQVISGFPSSMWAVKLDQGWWVFSIVIVIGLVIVGAVIFIEQAQRRIPVQYARRMVGRKMFGGSSTYIPLKVNQAGVIPVIFASSLMYLPAMAAQFNQNSDAAWVRWVSTYLVGGTHPLYMLAFFLLIVFFTYFYVSITFNPEEVADNMKKYGGFIPGIRAGKPTEDYLAYVLSRITLPGALYLGMISLIPLVALVLINANQNFPFGGTSILIMVGVALDTVKQIESQLQQRNYEGFLR